MVTKDAYSTSECGLSNLDFIAHAQGVVIKSQVWCVATEIEFVRAGSWTLEICERTPIDQKKGQEKLPANYLSLPVEYA